MSQGFWSDIRTEPKRQNRWIMNVGGVPQWMIKTTSKPSYVLSKTEHKYINHTFYYPGRVTWNTIDVTLVDPINPDASKTLETILRDSGYHFPTNPDDVSTVSKFKAVSALGRVVIAQFGPEGEIIEEWKLTNAWIESVKYGDLTYDDDGMVETTLTLAYDYAEIVTSADPGLPSSLPVR